MIIAFQGTDTGSHGAAAIMTFYAAVTAFDTGRKCLLMSLCAPDSERNIENLGYAKMEQYDDTLTPGIAASYNGSGITALIQRAETDNLDNENFLNCVVQQMKNSNGLDVAETATDENIEQDMDSRFNVFREITDVANTIYDYIFVLTDSQNVSLTKKVDELADRIVVCVRQSKFVKPVKLSEEAQKKAVYVVSDFEPESAFNKKFLMNKYNVKQHLFVMPHNIQYKDACVQGQLIQFAMKNTSATKTDDNAYLMQCMKELSVDLFGKLEDKPEPAYLSLPKFDPEKDELPEWVELSRPGVEKRTERKLLFGKTTYKAADFNVVPADDQAESTINDNILSVPDIDTPEDSADHDTDVSSLNVSNATNFDDDEANPGTLVIPSVPPLDDSSSDAPADVEEMVEEKSEDIPVLFEEEQEEKADKKHGKDKKKERFSFLGRKNKKEEEIMPEMPETEEKEVIKEEKEPESALTNIEVPDLLNESEQTDTEPITWLTHGTTPAGLHWYKMIRRPLEAVYEHLFGTSTAALTGSDDPKRSAMEYMRYISDYKPLELFCRKDFCLRIKNGLTVPQVGDTLKDYLKNEWKDRNPGMELNLMAFAVSDGNAYIQISFVPYNTGYEKALRVRNSLSAALAENNEPSLESWAQREAEYLRTRIMAAANV